MSWLSELFNLPAEISKVKAAIEETETDFENAIAAGTAAASVLEGIAANPTNIASDLAAVPSLIADVKAAASAGASIINILKSVSATKAPSTPTKAVTKPSSPIVIAPHPSAHPVEVPDAPSFPPTDSGDSGEGSGVPVQSSDIAAADEGAGSL